MKKIIAFLSLSLVLAAGLFAQVSAANVEKAYTILESTDDVLAPMKLSATLVLFRRGPTFATTML